MLLVSFFNLLSTRMYLQQKKIYHTAPFQQNFVVIVFPLLCDKLKHNRYMIGQVLLSLFKLLAYWVQTCFRYYPIVSLCQLDSYINKLLFDYFTSYQSSSIEIDLSPPIQKSSFLTQHHLPSSSSSLPAATMLLLSPSLSSWKRPFFAAYCLGRKKSFAAPVAEKKKEEQSGL